MIGCAMVVIGNPCLLHRRSEINKEARRVPGRGCGAGWIPAEPTTISSSGA